MFFFDFGLLGVGWSGGWSTFRFWASGVGGSGGLHHEKFVCYRFRPGIHVHLRWAFCSPLDCGAHGASCRMFLWELQGCHQESGPPILLFLPELPHQRTRKKKNFEGKRKDCPWLGWRRWKEHCSEDSREHAICLRSARAPCLVSKHK